MLCKRVYPTVQVWFPGGLGRVTVAGGRAGRKAGRDIEAGGGAGRQAGRDIVAGEMRGAEGIGSES